MGNKANKIEAKCEDCGLSYEKHGLDIVLSNEQWRMIAPDVGIILCGRCIAVRCDNLPSAVVIKANVEFLEISP